MPKIRNALIGLALSLLLTACGSSSDTATPSAAMAHPTGIYALGFSNEAPASAVISLPFVDGWVLRVGWKEIETAQGIYDFSKIDAALTALAPYGKKLTLAIFAVEVPAYILVQPGVSTYNVVIPSGVTTAVPWEEAAMLRWEEFCKALGDHRVSDVSQTVSLRNHSLLAQVDAPIMGLGGVRDIGTNGGLVKVTGYVRATFTNAALRSMQAMVVNFPNSFHYVEFFGMEDGISSPRLDHYLLDTFMTTFNNGTTPKLGFFQENLSCKDPGVFTPFAFDPTVKDRTYSMFQMLQSWIAPLSTDPQTLLKTDSCLSPPPVNGNRTQSVSGPGVAINNAYRTFGTRYFEIYRNDLSHPGFADEFNASHALLFP